MTYFWKPASFIASDNSPRRTGFELEFGNVAAQDTAIALQKALGGTVREMNPFAYKLTNSTLGTIKIERDAQLLNTVKYRDLFAKLGVDFTQDMVAAEIEKGVDKLSSLIIPCEVVTPPLLYEDFAKLNVLVRVLNDLHVEGTQNSILNAFGLHLNPSAPDLSASTLVRYMQAFLLLYDWIIDISDIDFTRRYLTSYIDPFPQEYAALVLDSAYTPSEQIFLQHYLQYNPTRNRALDLLPLLSELDYEAVHHAVLPEEKGLVGSRPAFHYRLPDCRIGQAGWTIAQEWNRWWYVETLAADDTLRHAMIGQWQENKDALFLVRKQQWVDSVQQFVDSRFPFPDAQEQETAQKTRDSGDMTAKAGASNV